MLGVGDQETWLEIGFALFGLGILAGIVALVYGRARGSTRRGRRHAEQPPQAGSIGAERHQHIATVAAR